MFKGDEDCGAEGDFQAGFNSEGDYQAGFKFPVVKFVTDGILSEPMQKKLKLKYFKRRLEKKKTSSGKTCVDDNGKTRRVGFLKSKSCVSYFLTTNGILSE